MLEPGSRAPDFRAETQDGTISLSSLKGKNVVLYFYPKDDTPGCTKEACSFRDNMVLLKNAVVIGVSKDSPESHREFARKYGLNFHLAADPGGKIIRAYGAEGTEGKAKRVTYIIDRDGRIAHVFPKVVPDEHSAEVLKILGKLR